MNEQHDDTRERRVNRILAAYLQAVEAGSAPSREQLLAEHPELAAELQEFLTNQDAIERLAGHIPPPGQEEVTLRAGEATPSPASAPPAAGDRMRYFGDYELLQEIARGGMGVVYKARQVNLKRIVAVKLILAGELASDEDVRRFYSEAEAAAKLDHPGIVPIFEVGQHQGQHYFSMAFVEGQSLAHRIARGVLSAKEAATFIKSVADAIAYAHVEGIVHRDLKPANILLDKDGQPRVTDFGLAKRVEADAEMTATGQILGTPSYMPPEQASGRREAVGPWSDIYSLGAVLYCLIAGRPPFQAATPLDTLLQVLNEEPIPPRQLNANVPRDLDTVCMKCLQKEPGKRYRSAQLLADDLERFLHGEPIQARPVGKWERGWRWCRRNPLVAALAATCLVLLLSVTTISVAAAFRIHHDNVQLVEANNAQKKAEESARTELYYNQITLSHLYWKAGDVERAEQLISESSPAHRGWEWHYLRRLCHAELNTLQGHSGIPAAVAFFPDGRRLVSVGGFPAVHPNTHGEIRIWDLNTGAQLKHWSGHASMIQGVAVTADGSKIVTGGEDRRICIWNAETGELLKTLEGHRLPIRTLQLSRDGQRIATVSRRSQQSETPGAPLLEQLQTFTLAKGELKIWDLESGENLQSVNTPAGLYDVAFNHDATRVATVGDLPGNIWDVATGELLSTVGPLNGSAIDWNAAGTQLAIAVGNEIKVYDEEGNEQQTLRGSGAWQMCVRFSPDGSHIAAGNEQILRLWDVGSGKEVASYRGHRYSVNTVDFSRDGRRLVTTSHDGLIKVWDPRVDPAAMTIRRKFNVLDVAFSPKRDRLAAATTGEAAVFVFDTTSGEPLFQLDHPGASCVAFTPSGEQLISGGFDEQIRIWNTSDSPEERSTPFFGLTDRRLMRTIRDHTDHVSSVACRPDGEQFASVSWDGTLRIWSLADGRQLHQHQLGAQAFLVRYAPDGASLAATSGAEITVCDAATGEILWQHREMGGLSTLAYSHDGRKLAYWRRDKLVLLESSSGQELQQFSGLSTQVTALAFDNSGNRLFLSGLDSSIQILDTATGRETLRLVGHEGAVQALAVDGTGHWLASGGVDGTVRIWNALPLEGR